MLNCGDKVRIHYDSDKRLVSMYTPYWASGETATVIRVEQDAVYVKIDRYAICYVYCDPRDLKRI